MARTEEQQKIIDTCVSVLQKKDKDNALVKISAVAGSGKTFTLIEIAKELEAYCRSNNRHHSIFSIKTKNRKQ